MKGAIKLSALEQAELLSNTRFILMVVPEDIHYKIKLGGRAIQLNETIYKPLVEALVDRPQTLRTMMKSTS